MIARFAILGAVLIGALFAAPEASKAEILQLMLKEDRRVQTLEAPVSPPGGLPDGGIAQSGDIKAAYYTQPTRRYAHAIMGDGIEGGALTVVDQSGKQHELVLEDRYVFEDLTPRLVDLNGDGRLEIVTIRAESRSGGAIVIYALNEQGLYLVDATPEIGTANRWLNPAGFADFDGDGKLEMAYVQTPHIGGTLFFWRLEGEELQQVARISGFSNHAIGARALGLSAAFDLERDGAYELLIPENGRQSLALVAWQEEGPKVIDRIRLPAPIAGDFILTDRHEGALPKVEIPLHNGQLAEVTFKLPQ